LVRVSPPLEIYARLLGSEVAVADITTVVEATLPSIIGEKIAKLLGHFNTNLHGMCF
jgi:hypothetical protein